MAIETTCRICGEPFSPSAAAIIAGTWRDCETCQEDRVRDGLPPRPGRGQKTASLAQPENATVRAVKAPPRDVRAINDL